MSDPLLKALGRVGREERAAAEQSAEDAPPLAESLREQMVSRALSELETPRKTAPRRWAPRAPRVLLAGGLALAAALALWVSTRSDALPGYRLTVHGGTTEWRASGDRPTADRIEARADGALEILVRPETPVARPLEARAFALGDGAQRDLPVEISSQGVARVAGPVEALFGAAAPSTWQVVVVIGPAGDVPRSLDEARARAGLRIVEAWVAITP
jgi:hypothetical protein